jgi:hypothetical protein
MTAQELKEFLQSKDLQGLALDIDETLADSGLHWFKRVYEFHPIKNLTLSEVAKKYGFVEDVPEWDGTQETRDFMQSLLHSDEFNESIPLIEDANHIVNKINETVPIVAYITARPSTVRNSTEIWLKKHGFPDAPLLMRGEDVQVTTSDGLGRNKWKAQVLLDLYPYVNGIIDDNVLLTHELQHLDYQGVLYVYGNGTNEFDHYKHVVVCPTWQSVLDRIESQHI